MALANEGLVDDFAKLKQTYTMTAMLGVNTPKKAVQPLNVRYSTLASITSLYAEDDSKAKAAMSAKGFDSTEGEMVFEAVRGSSEVSTFGGPPYQRAVNRTAQALSGALLVLYRQK